MPVNAKQNNTRLFLFSFALLQTESLGWMEKLETELNQEKIQWWELLPSEMSYKRWIQTSKGRKQICKDVQRWEVFGRIHNISFTVKVTQMLCALVRWLLVVVSFSSWVRMIWYWQHLKMYPLLQQFLKFCIIRGRFNRLKTFTQEKEWNFSMQRLRQELRSYVCNIWYPCMGLSNSRDGWHTR